MKTVITTDWAPHIERAVRAVVPVLVAVYAAGYATGAWLHRTSDRLARLWVRLWVPDRIRPWLIADALQFMDDYDATFAALARPERAIVQHQAAAAAPANVAPPRPADPMARAVLKVRSGMSQRQAASLCGVSRTSLQRALKVAS